MHVCTFLLFVSKILFGFLWNDHEMREMTIPCQRNTDSGAGFGFCTQLVCTLHWWLGKSSPTDPGTMLSSSPKVTKPTVSVLPYPWMRLFIPVLAITCLTQLAGVTDPPVKKTVFERSTPTWLMASWGSFVISVKKFPVMNNDLIWKLETSADWFFFLEKVYAVIVPFIVMWVLSHHSYIVLFAYFQAFHCRRRRAQDSQMFEMECDRQKHKPCYVEWWSSL